MSRRIIRVEIWLLSVIGAREYSGQLGGDQMQYKVKACLHSRMYLLILSNSMSDVRKRNVAKRVDMIFPFMALLLFHSDSVTQGEFRREFWTSCTYIM